MNTAPMGLSQIFQPRYFLYCALWNGSFELISVKMNKRWYSTLSRKTTQRETLWNSNDAVFSCFSAYTQKVKLQGRPCHNGAISQLLDVYQKDEKISHVSIAADLSIFN